MAEQEPRRLTPPVRGVTDKTTKVDQPGVMCPPDSMRNVVPFPSPDLVPAIGTRAGTSKKFPQVFGNGAAVGI